jgi:hypothetical protein
VRIESRFRAAESEHYASQMWNRLFYYESLDMAQSV